ISLVDHPAQSLDLNPIEPLWHDLKEIIRAQHTVSTINDLKAAAHAAWDALPIETVNQHIYQMPDCVQAVLASKGGHTQL
ncbi:hypothetical protein FA15DRAFT_602638, partial [Coprinopsis marcescibilis]